jgi:hypothetical protein
VAPWISHGSERVVPPYGSQFGLKNVPDMHLPELNSGTLIVSAINWNDRQRNVKNIATLFY